MLHVIEIRRGREELSILMARVGEWLDKERFERDAYRCTTDKTSLTCRMEFELESEAAACAEAFGGEVRPIEDKPAE